MYTYAPVVVPIAPIDHALLVAEAAVPSVGGGDNEQEEDEEELKLCYEEACNEAVELAQQLRAAKLEAEQLRIRLKASGLDKAPVTGVLAQSSVPTPPSVEDSILEQRMRGIHDMFKWIAEHIDLSHVDIFDVGCEVPISGRSFRLQKVAQWSLPTAPGKRLKLSVPIEHQDEVVQVLQKAKSTGQLGNRQELQRLASAWELVPGELQLPMGAISSTEPAVLLANRVSSRGILVATWPTREALEAFAILHTQDGRLPIPGQRVEALFEGTWYVGTLETMDITGKATIKCDVDEPGVFTIVPLNQVRKIQTTASGAESLSPPAAPTMCGGSAQRRARSAT